MFSSGAIEALYELLVASEEPTSAQIALIAGPGRDERVLFQLHQLLRSLRLAGSRFEPTRESILVGSSAGITGTIDITPDDEGLIDKIVVRPSIPFINDAQTFAAAISRVGGHSATFEADTDGPLTTAEVQHSFAVASLIKLIVAVAVERGIRRGDLTWSSTATLLKDDISVLSGGLSKADVGRTVSVRDLVTSMLVASDNTAMDVLVRIVGHHALHDLMSSLDDLGEAAAIQPTRSVYGRAWCAPNEPESQWRERALIDVTWTRGLDYFLRLPVIERAVMELLGAEWSPWDAYGNKDRMLYKGGSAPGVLSAVWGRGSASWKSMLGFVINRREPLGLIEELYAFECARVRLQQRSLVDVAPGEGHAR